jgi:hypothetical protein
VVCQYAEVASNLLVAAVEEHLPKKVKVDFKVLYSHRPLHYNHQHHGLSKAQQWKSAGHLLKEWQRS